MITKSGGICYLFDFDGTLAGQESFHGYIDCWKEAYKSGVYINPGEYDIRWSILTGRPKIDWPVLKFFCIFQGLFPETILMIDSWRYPYEGNREGKFQWKLETLRKVVSNRVPQLCKIRPIMISKVIYIDNDLDTVSYINSNKKIGESIIAASVQDFVRGNLEILL